MTKLIYLGCLSRSRYVETCDNALKLIQTIDPEFELIENPPCCGSLAHHVATKEELLNHARFVNKWFEENHVYELVTICAGCYNYLSQKYPPLLGSEFKVKTKHLLQFLCEDENLSKLNLKYEGKRLIVNYHDGCHLRNAVPPIIEEPRKIINSIKNIELKEMENNSLNSICCGAGGGVYSIYKENSDINSKVIFDQMRRSKALLTPCPFCYTAFKRVREENNVKIPVIKFEDFIINIMNGVDPIS